MTDKYQPPPGPPPSYPTQPQPSYPGPYPNQEPYSNNNNYYPSESQPGPGGYYSQPPPQQMYYQQGPPPPQGYFADERGYGGGYNQGRYGPGGSASEGICAGLMGALACCCCLELLF